MGPAQIQQWLEDNSHRLDLAVQFLGDEPNAVAKPWDSVGLRVLLAAAWPYEQAVGNSSIPAVYQCINNTTVALADRSYLPATPRDLNLLAGAGLGCFGVETKHPARDFDIVATSISYPVLSMSFVKQLTTSGLPARWRDRDPDAGAWPMVMVGGLSYGAPEVLAPVVDCWWLGEAEDEPANPGIAAVCERIAAMKATGAWTGDRVGCYDELAREFGFLYFPRHIRIHYGARDRTAVGVGPHLSKQVIGWTATLPGLKLPLRRRHVRDLDAIAPLDAPPLLYADPALGAGDAEVQRGCPAWSIPVDASVEIAGRGLVRFDSVRPGELIRSGSEYRRVAGVVVHGLRTTVRVQTREGHEVECTPDHEIQVVRTGPELEARVKVVGRRRALDEAAREWVHADQLQPGDRLQSFYGGVVWPQEPRLLQDVPTYQVGRPRRDGSRAERSYPEPFPTILSRDVGWFLGLVAGDCYVRSNQLDFRIEDRAWPLVDRFRQVAKELFGLDPTYSQSAEGPSGIYRLNSARLVAWLRVNFGIGSNLTRKRVPEQILASPRAVVGDYLSALYDSNGTHLKPTSKGAVTTIRFIAYSESFTRQVAELFRMFGLPAAIRSEVRGIKRDGRPSDRDSVKWEVRSTAPADGSYDWLVSLDPFKARFLAEHFRAPVSAAHCKGQRGLVYLTVTGLAPGRVVQVMDVDVPGPQAFNVNGIYVHNCSFCALTYRQKPYRQRSVDYTVAHAKALRANMGSVRLTPFGPDFPMHTQRKALVAALLEQVCDEVDASTMRVDDFIADPEFITLQVAGGMHTVTLGVEGTSQRMRDLVGKGTADADICEAVTRGIAAGIRRFKLFMISGLPGEDEGDVYRILDLAKSLADIRESMAQPTVRIQLSWTPLMVEANTPMQWFAPTAASRVLGDVFDELRELGIDFKLGSKAEPNKALFFQLAHRASRDVGEALVDAMTEVDTACWGGVPRTFAATLEAALRRHGFANGSADCFDERAKPDMFGWEFIDQGINVELLWTTYLQMREFAEATTSHSYDTAYGADFHGNEWIERCDTRCQGKACGACDYTDLRIRTGYLRAVDRATAPGTVTPVDQRSQAVRVRARLHTPDRYRMVGNDHHRFALRRAAHRAQAALDSPAALAGRSVRFASDTFAHRGFTAGVDYAEFALTRPLTDDALDAYLAAMAAELAPWRHLSAYARHPAGVRGLTSDVDTQLVDLSVDVDPITLTARLADWGRRRHIPIRCLLVGGYFAPATETVNAHAHVDALWAVRAGHQVRLRMLLRGRPSPYAVAAALLGRPSWLDLARHVATRADVFVAPGAGPPACPDCDQPVPTDPLGGTAPRCPPCHDLDTGTVIAAADLSTHRLERTPA